MAVLTAVKNFYASIFKTYYIYSVGFMKKNSDKFTIIIIKNTPFYLYIDLRKVYLI